MYSIFNRIPRMTVHFRRPNTFFPHRRMKTWISNEIVNPHYADSVEDELEMWLISSRLMGLNKAEKTIWLGGDME